MAVTIVNIDSTTFSLNGIKYLKNFQSIVYGDLIEISNVYDSKLILVQKSNFSDFIVNGNTFLSAISLQNSLYNILFGFNTILSSYLPLTGGTLTGQLTVNAPLQVNNNDITVAGAKINSQGGYTAADTLGGGYIIDGRTNVDYLKADGSTSTDADISITESQISDFGSYEPTFSKNTAFNKDFGTIAGTVAEGNHNHTGVYQPAGTYDNYVNWNLKVGGVQKTTVVSGGNLDITAGTDIGVTYGAGGVVTINNTLVAGTDYIAGGVGTANYLSKFTANGAVGNSLIYDNGTNIGIGTVNPSNILTIGGATNKTIAVDTLNTRGYFGGWSTFAMMGVNRDPANGVLKDVNAGTGLLSLHSSNSNAYFAISLNGVNGGIPSEKFRIDKDGNTGIGTTTPTEKLDVVGNGKFSGSATATAFYASSDIRLKNVIKRDGDVIYFKWKDKRDELTHIGYSAQEVKKNYPNQVQKDRKGFLSVNYTEVLVAKIKQLENRIKKLENGI